MSAYKQLGRKLSSSWNTARFAASRDCKELQRIVRKSGEPIEGNW